MQSRLLIINCPSKYFFYIPMGTFGICDYLSRRHTPVKLLNLAVYKEAEAYKVMERYLKSFRPTHVGIIFHWQETAEGFLRVGDLIKSQNKDIRILTGGFTAGYFDTDLLRKCSFLNYVVKGDPEKPLELLLDGTELSQVPNLIYRDSGRIRRNRKSYSIDQETLSGISFSGLTHLHDYELYVEAINRKLGFPVFIGRGCVHNCRYCGGSRSASRSHSLRTSPVSRSIDAVISDLKKLKDFTSTIYMCHENDRDYIKALFAKMKEDESLVKAFRLNYGAWRPLDEEFLKLYKDLFILSGNTKSVFELSPEVFDDQGRRKIKSRGVYFSTTELKENLSLINTNLGNSVNVSVFFSRYHDTVKTYSGMKEEIAGIFRLKHDLFRDRIVNTNVSYDHLSTDIASRYWEKYVKRPKGFRTLITAIRKIGKRAKKSFPVDNLCLYIPEDLSKNEVYRCELLIFIMKNIERFSGEMFHIMFECLDSLMIDTIEDVAAESYSNRSGNVFASFDYRELLNLLKQKFAGDNSLVERIPFAEDLISLNLRKLLACEQPSDPKSGCQAQFPKLDHNLISIHGHDYLDLRRFLARLGKEGPQNLRPEKTVYVFLSDEILSLTYETYDFTLKEFENDITVDDYYTIMDKRGLFTHSYHENLIRKLFQSGVLV
jgi:hypothetical protein